MTPTSSSNEHRVHAALYRPVLFVGVTPNLAVLEVTTLFALVFLVGLHLTTIVLVAVYLVVMHPVAVWVTAQDPQMLALYARSLGFRDFYWPHAPPHARTPAVRPSLTHSRTHAS